MYYDTITSARPGDTVIRLSSSVPEDIGEVRQDGKIQYKAPDGSILISDKESFVAGVAAIVKRP